MPGSVGDIYLGLEHVCLGVIVFGGTHMPGPVGIGIEIAADCFGEVRVHFVLIVPVVRHLHVLGSIIIVMDSGRRRRVHREFNGTEFIIGRTAPAAANGEAGHE